MTTKINVCVVITFLILLLSCEKKTTKVNKEYNDERVSQLVGAEYSMEFPDTVYRNQSYEGQIYYKGSFDTIITELVNKEKYRYILFRSLKSENVDYTVEHLKRIVKDTFGAVTNRIIPLNNVVFGNKGEFFIDGIIEDTVIIDSHEKNEEGKNIEQLMRQEFRITKKVVVIDKE